MTPRKSLPLADTSVLHIQSFGAGSAAHGGRRRSLQIEELCKSRSVHSICVAYSFHDGIRAVKARPGKVARLVWRAVLLGYGRIRLKAILQSAVIAEAILDLVHSGNIRTLIVETSPGPIFLALQLLRGSGVVILVLPHNVECLAAGNNLVPYISRSALLDMEVNAYLTADAVACISSFDRQAVEILTGRPAGLLPYYPPVAVQSRLRAIRARRQQEVGEYFLILGSVGNFPTRLGLEILLKEIRSNSFDCHVKVAGFGTDVFSSFSSERIDVLGSIDEHRLDELLSSCRGLILRQAATSGMATRLVEANLARIPCFIFDGYIQAWGLEEYGIIVIQHISELLRRAEEVEGRAIWREFEQLPLEAVFNEYLSDQGNTYGEEVYPALANQ